MVSSTPQDVQEKAIDGTLSQECTSPFSMALSEFLNNLAKHTKKSGSVEDAFNTLQRTDHHLGKWSENLVGCLGIMAGRSYLSHITCDLTLCGLCFSC